MGFLLSSFVWTRPVHTMPERAQRNSPAHDEVNAAQADTKVILRQFTDLHHRPTVCKEMENILWALFSFTFDLYVC